jgi:S-adenosylmethionine/arginine decarboxylase-like enzyme
VESLGYGTQLILDGFNADAKKLQDENLVRMCLNEVAALLESTQSDMTQLRDSAGVSATLRLAESHLSLHTFSNQVSLQIFSRHDLPLSAVTELLANAFSVRRVESFLSNHAKTLPQDSEARKKVLAGDRAYSSLRLAETSGTE